jgi:hypothetical protein
VRRFKDLPAAQIGLLGEKFVGRLLRSKPGVGVIATLKFTGENDNEAPSLEFDDKKITLADYDVSMRGRTFSVEAKTYGAPAPNREHGCDVHGVPVRKFDQYCAQEIERGIPVYLGVLEVDSGVFLISDEPISKIAPRYACGCRGCKGGQTCDLKLRWGNDYPQWYFRRDSFHEWARLEGEDLTRLQREHGRVSHAIRKHRDNEVFNAYPQHGEPWVWACLGCNATWISDRRHSCESKRQLVEYWTRRLRSVVADIDAVVARPVMRSELVQWMGPKWLPEADFR